MSLCTLAKAQQSVSLSWNPVAGPATAGYAIYRGSTHSNYASRIDVGTNTTVTLTGLPTGQTNYFAVVAYNSVKVDGLPSNEAIYVAVTNAPTNAPTNITVALPQRLSITNNGQIRVTAAAVSNVAYLLQSSTNLANWSFVYTNQPGQALNYTQAVPSGRDWKYFRALGVTGGISSSNITQALTAHRFSSNAVGYVSILAPPGDSIISNPFDAGSNTLASLLSVVPEGTVLRKYTPGDGYDTNTFSGGKWDHGNVSLEPGEAGFINNPTGTNLHLVIAGQLISGTLTNPIPAGYSLTSAVVPASNFLQTFPAVAGDQIQIYDGKWITYTYNSGNWRIAKGKNVPLVIDPGEGFFITKSAAANWVQTFNPAN